MGKISDSTKIAGDFKVEHWKKLRQKLLDYEGDNSDAWEEAYSVFKKRINTRFIEPINRILAMGIDRGEGFSAAALQCILIEFLEAFYQGRIYTPAWTEEKLKSYAKKLGISKGDLEKHLQPHEYNSSAKLFKDFLIGHDPFRQEFSQPLANAFYRSVRCGLLHEAATKGGTTIKVRSTSLIQPKGGDDIVLYRTNFQEAIDIFIEDYKQELLASQERKKAFILKMDDICQMERIYYFAYGSNMRSEQLKDRVGTIHDKVAGYIKDYAFLYNKKGEDGSSKANIQSSDGSQTQGVCFELDLEGFKKLQSFEKGYDTVEKPFYSGTDAMIIAKTFISKSISDAPPNQDYADIVVSGARENNLPEEYIENVLKYSSS